MQILEQLTYGYANDVTESDMLMDCASITGYLECTKLMLDNDILTESAITEGIGTTVLGWFRTIAEKVKVFFKKLASFFRRKKAPKPKVTKTEVTEEWLNDHPYNGPTPSSRKDAANAISATAKAVAKKSTGVINNATGVLKTKEGDSESTTQTTNLMLKYMDHIYEAFDGNEYVSAPKSPDGVGVALLNIYKVICNGEEANHEGAFTKEEFDSFNKQIVSMSEQFDESSRSVANRVDECASRLDDTIHTVDTMIKDGTGNFIDGAEMQVLQRELTNVYKSLMSCSKGLTESFSNIEKDMDTMIAYVNSAK